MGLHTQQLTALGKNAERRKGMKKHNVISCTYSTVVPLSLIQPCHVLLPALPMNVYEEASGIDNASQIPPRPLLPSQQRPSTNHFSRALILSNITTAFIAYKESITCMFLNSSDATHFIDALSDQFHPTPLR